MVRRILSVALVLILCSGLFLSCGNSNSSPEAATQKETSEIPASVATEPVIPLPEADFDGRNVNLYIGDYFCFINKTEETGESLNDAVYRRNRKVEEMYNVKFKFSGSAGNSSDYSPWYTALEASIMASDHSIDIAAGYFYRLAGTSATSGLFQNLMDLPEIDFSQEWWIGDLINHAAIGNKLFITTGNLDTGFYDRIYTLVFNKGLAKSLKTEDIYSLVRDGKWTFDKLKSITSAVKSDINGDSVMDENDRWGYISGNNMAVDAFNSAFNVDYIEYDKNGMPNLLGLTEKIADVVNSVQRFLTESGDALYIKEANSPAPQYTAFEEGRCLILATQMLEIQKMRGYDIEFGIIPYPKWDEKQDKYFTNVIIGNTAGYLVPVTSDSKLSGCVLEALSYYGWTDVYPEYYERVLSGKVARDSESVEMLDIIFSNIRYEFTQIYSYAFGDQKSTYNMMRMVLKNNEKIASYYASNEALFKSTLEKLSSALG